MTAVVPLNPRQGDRSSSSKGGPTLQAASRTTTLPQTTHPLPPTPLLTLQRTTRQYSLDKFKELDAYCATVTHRRIALVLCVLPLPGLAASTVPCFMRLQDVRDGPNWGFVFHLASAVTASTSGFLLTCLQVTRVPRTIYSFRQVFTVCMITTVLQTLLFAMLWFYVLFPIPFTWVAGTPTLFTALAIAHLIVLRSRLWTQPVLSRAARSYGPSAVVQASQIALYPAVSVLFDNVSQFWQVVLTLAYPLLKFALKAYLTKVAKGLQDFSVEVAVCGVEITASLYQSMIMQTSPSVVAMACIIGIDLLQGLTMVKFFVDRHSTALVVADRTDGATSTTKVPNRHQLIPLARVLLRSGALDSIMNPATVSDMTIGQQILLSPSRMDGVRHNELAELVESMTADEKCRTFTTVLETLHAAEEILLTQYIEVIVPVINGLFLAVATQFPSGRYNTRLASFYESTETSTTAASLSNALQSIALYSFLQGITLVIMQGVLKRRYGISAMSYLAFILEHHGLSIVGKMMAWLPVILHFTVVQYGTDFTFGFHWDRSD